MELACKERIMTFEPDTEATVFSYFEELTERRVREYIEWYPNLSDKFEDRDKQLFLALNSKNPPLVLFDTLLPTMLELADKYHDSYDPYKWEFVDSQLVKAVLEHPACPPEHIRRGLHSLIWQYRQSASLNPSAPEDAAVEYWLFEGHKY
jgi:hypothetical protein